MSDGPGPSSLNSWSFPRPFSPLDTKAPMSLSQTVKGLQNNATTAIQLYAKENPVLGPSVQRLVTGYEAWENKLRREAQSRLENGFAADLLSDGDWDLLRRVPKSLPSSSMKKSASEGRLEGLVGASGSSNPSSSRLGGTSSRHAFSGSDGRTGGSMRDEASMYGPRLAPMRFPTGGFQPSEQQLLRLGIPRVPTAPSLQAMSDTLNLEAAKNIEAFLDNSLKAIKSAQSSIQQTAANCQQNLHSLTTMIQHNVASNPNLRSARDAVTWSIATSSDPFTGALVPWSVFPRYLRARELDQALNAASPSSEAEHSASGSPTDWVAPFDQYMSQLDSARSSGKAAALRKSVREPGRQVAIVTTASLPWMTGTSVNPLLRAAYLSATDETRRVTLVIPWLSMPDQERLFPEETRFQTPEDQEEYVRAWARKRTGLDCNFRISFYPGRYAAEKGSILPVGDITQVIPDHEADVAVLEEPEHLNWYHHGRRWTDKFNHVVGVMHTNYLDYARREEGGHMKELILKHINAWVCRIHCHKVIKLSDAVQQLPRQETMFVHGVSPSFIKVGALKAAQMQEGGKEAWDKGVYFIGKVLWAKGYTELLERMKEHTQRTGENVHVDVYGSGPDLKAVQEEARKRELNLSFNGARDHADRSLQDYKVFVNPSLSDVVATTTAEALAMGKFVVCADHPSNRFFSRFPNCLIYRDGAEFSRCLSTALTEQPRPLTAEELHSLTWEAATERFLDVADIRSWQRPLEAAMDSVLYAAHNTLSGIESIRVLAGAGPRTRDLPARVTDYVPSDDSHSGGLFDNHARAKGSHNPLPAEKTKEPKELEKAAQSTPPQGKAKGQEKAPPQDKTKASKELEKASKEVEKAVHSSAQQDKTKDSRDQGKGKAQDRGKDKAKDKARRRPAVVEEAGTSALA